MMMGVITKIYLVNMIMLASCVAVLSVITNPTPEMTHVAELIGSWGAYTVLATPVYLIFLVATWGNRKDRACK